MVGLIKQHGIKKEHLSAGANKKVTKGNKR